MDHNEGLIINISTIENIGSVIKKFITKGSVFFLKLKNCIKFFY